MRFFYNTAIATIYKEFLLEMLYLVIVAISKLSLMTIKEKFVRITMKLACVRDVDNLQEFSPKN